MKKFKQHIIFLLCLTPGINSLAQNDRINPDRPGFLTGTYIVNDGFYTETGYQYSAGRSSNQFRYSEYPNINIRFGLANKLEMFITWTGLRVVHQSVYDVTSDSYLFSEATIPGTGWKYGLAVTEDYNIVLLGAIDCNNQNGKLYFEPSFGMAWDCALVNMLNVYGMEQAVIEKSTIGNNLALVSGVGFNCDITPKLTPFIEYYNQAYSSLKQINHGCEFGFIILLTRDTQIDFYGGLVFNNDPVKYLGIGFSRRCSSKKDIN